MPVGTIWSQEEDERLAQLVKVYGPKKWSQIASELGTKGSKQCRRRWKNFISLDDRKQGSWTPEEDAQLLDGHRRHGNKWTIIAQEIGGRTDNAVKNRWAALGKKRKFEEDPSAPRNDLLSVQRIIYKDQPRHRATTAAEAAWLQEQFRQDEQQVPYSIPAAMLGGQTDITHLNNLPRKPDLMINIPGATAVEVPYSQRSQGNIQFRVHKGSLTPVEMQLAQELNGMDLPVQIRVEDDTLLSTSRQAAQNAIAALASPTEEPDGTITSLYKYLCSATPQDAQQQVTSGRRSPPPWGSRSDLTQGMMQQQQQPQTLQPAQVPGLLPHQQQQQQLLPVTGQMQQQQQQQQQMYQPLQMPQQQMPMLLAQPGRALQQQQQQQSAQMLQQPAAMQYQHAPQQQVMYAQPVMINDGHKQLVQKVARMCAGQEYSTAPPCYSPALLGSMPPNASFAGSQAAAGAGAGGVMQGGLVVPINTMQQEMNRQQLQQGQQTRYPQGTWQQQQQGYSSVPAAGHYNPPVVTSGMPVGYQAEQQQQQPQQQMLPPPMHHEEQKQWGPEELRQLLDLLGDHQQQQQQGVCAAGGVVGSGQPPQQHSPPEEEVEQVNNGRMQGAAAQPGMGLMAPEGAAGCQVPPLGPPGGMVYQ